MNIKKMHLINIMTFEGRLGNQMFQFTKSLDIMHFDPLRPMIYSLGNSIKPWHGPNVLNVFHINRHITAYKGTLSHLCKKYYGYFQDVNLVNSHKHKLKKYFVFDENYMNRETMYFSRQIKNTNSCSIHVRRTDYLNEKKFQTFDYSYYQKAAGVIQEKMGTGATPKFYIFSDDIVWCKQNMDIPNATFIDWNNGDDYWQDMYLMSCCKHNIIANSTFSWWGAWLNKNLDKIIIAPQRWTNDSKIDSLIPENWIRI